MQKYNNNAFLSIVENDRITSHAGLLYSGLQRFHCKIQHRTLSPPLPPPSPIAVYNLAH